MKLKKWLVLLMAAVLVIIMAGCGANKPAESDKDNSTEIDVNDSGTEEDSSGENAIGDGKVMVVYFSYTGHLDSMAHWIADETGGDLFRVTAKEAYSDNYDETVDRAKKEQDEDARPDINVDITTEQLAGYDTVFFGFPVWWYDIPMPMYTFLDSYDFSGKTIIPFLSHEGTSNGGSAKETIEQHASGADLRFDDALSIKGGDVESSEQDVRSWVNSLGYKK